MRKLIAIALLALVPLAGFGQTFYTNTSTKVLDIQNQASDFGDFRFTWRGYEDQIVKFVITTNGGGMDISTSAAVFKMSKRVSGGSNVCYLIKNTGDITISTSNVTFTVSHTNIPPDDSYNAELLLLDSVATNITMTAGRGKVKVEESLFDDDDGSWVSPTITNLIDYLTKTEAATSYLAIATNTKAASLILTTDGTNNYWSTSGAGDFLADGSVAMTGDFDGGGNDVTNVGTFAATGDVTVAGVSVLTNEADKLQTVINRETATPVTNLPSVESASSTTADLERVEADAVYWEEDTGFNTYDKYNDTTSKRETYMEDGASWVLYENGTALVTVAEGSADFAGNAIRTTQTPSATNDVCNKAYVDAAGTVLTTGKLDKTEFFNRTISAGTGLTGGGDLSTNRSLAFDTSWGDDRYVTTDTNTYSELIVANSNSLGAELVVNGAFTNSEHWVLSNAIITNAGTYANAVLILAGQNATLSPSNAIGIETGSTYLISYEVISFGDSVTNWFTMGSKTSQFVNASRQTNSTFHPCLDQTNLQINVTNGATYDIYIDDVSVKKAQSGDAFIANDLGVGGDGRISGNLHVVGSITLDGELVLTNVLNLSVGVSNTVANNSLASGSNNTANGKFSFAQGEENTVTGKWASAFGNLNESRGLGSSTRGSGNQAFGDYSVAEGLDSKAYGEASYAGGNTCISSGNYSRALGENATALHHNSYVWSDGTSQSSSTSGTYTVAASNGFFVVGSADVSSNLTVDGYIIGNGYMCEQVMKTNGVQAITAAAGWVSITNWQPNITDAGFSRTHSNITVTAAGRYTASIHISFTTDSASAPECHLFTNGTDVVIGGENAVGWARNIGIGGGAGDGSASATATIDAAAGANLSWKIDVPDDETFTFKHATFRVQRN